MQQREEDFVELSADEGADYDERKDIELNELEPLIAKPHSPGNVVAVSEVAGARPRRSASAAQSLRLRGPGRRCCGLARRDSLSPVSS